MQGRCRVSGKLLPSWKLPSLAATELVCVACCRCARRAPYGEWGRRAHLVFVADVWAGASYRCITQCAERWGTFPAPRLAGWYSSGISLSLCQSVPGAWDLGGGNPYVVVRVLRYFSRMGCTSIPMGNAARRREGRGCRYR